MLSSITPKVMIDLKDDHNEKTIRHIGLKLPLDNDFMYKITFSKEINFLSADGTSFVR